ncbi:hypothetical protein L226DRAFT_611289 [Lentinus tigrinus ALCF2SS1-7]|uniref:uncharacterized protein n=1 Tax=Lentinus tigrinus ALCF2SS1-7 TaxID=1328758 RepID=UPI001165FA69|nr:hypothetical protein L226DRAFT_611289 [Lentinus tigrinus ALCF2SS1-7]
MMGRQCRTLCRAFSSLCTMENCRLPLELCELVIDNIPRSHPWWEGHGGYDLPSYRVKFTTICSAWLPRALRILYHTPVLTEPQQLELFVHTITRRPPLADMVYELVIDPSDPRKYIPFLRHTLVKRLRHLTTLILGFPSRMVWVYPPRYHLLVAQFPITELAIHYRQFLSSFRTVWFETFRLIWSLRHLRKLHLDMQLDTVPDLTDTDVHRLAAIRRPWACANLKTLVLDGWDYHDLLPEHAFGTAVERLCFQLYGNPISESGVFFTQMSDFSSLQELYVAVKAGIGNSQDGEEASITSAYLAPILTHLPPQNALATITIRLDDAGGHAQPSREAFLRELSSRGVDQLVTKKFPGLRSARFEVPECFDSAYDEEWWHRLLVEHLPKLRGIVSVSVHTYGQDDWRAKSLCWDDEDDDSFQDVSELGDRRNESSDEDGDEDIALEAGS